MLQDNYLNTLPHLVYVSLLKSAEFATKTETEHYYFMNRAT